MKYKHAESEGWYYQIDDQGNKGQSWNKKNRSKMYEQMQTWVDEGNTIEPQYTAEEQDIKDQAEAEAEAIAWIGQREAEYPTTKELIVALWEKVIEGRPESADVLEIKRQAIKEKYPIPP